MRQLLLTVAFLVLAAGVVSAQDTRPPVEISAGVSRLTAIPISIDDIEGPSLPPAADFRVTLPFSPRFSMEGEMTLGPTEDSGQRIGGVYLIQVKQRLVRATRGGFHPFLTYGALGYFERSRYPAYTFTRADGTSITEPSRSYGTAIPPFLAVVGGGVQQRLGSRLAFRADAQLISLLWIPLGTRISTGLTVSVGGRH